MKFILSYNFLLALFSVVVDSDKLLTTTSGRLKGKLVTTRYGNVLQYLGVKYAVAERFDKPTRFIPNDETSQIDATSFGPACQQPPHLDKVMYPQIHSRGTSERSEDCLYLNIYSPITDTNELRAAMLWVPGEGFNFADASQFDGTWLAVNGDVVVVTVNYRVGVFGFLSTGNDTIPGNVALWDVVEAIKWVKENAAALGVDENNITAFGRFTGAMILSLLVTSPQFFPQGNSEPALFRRAILHSGVASGSYIIDARPMNSTQALISESGCGGASIEETVYCLKNLPAAQIENISWLVPNHWRPALDGDIVVGDVLKNVRKRTHSSNIDIMIGEAFDEGAICILHHYVLETMYAQQINDNTISKREFVDLIKEHLKDVYRVADPSVVDAAVHEYQFSEAALSYRDSFLKFCGLLYTRAKTELFARALAKRRTRVFRFQFNHRPSISPHPEYLGAAHGDDVFLLFLPILEAGFLDDAEIRVARKLAVAWANFAKFGNPNGARDNGLGWPEFTDHGKNIYVFSTNEERSVKSTNAWNRDIDFWGSTVPSLMRNTHRLLVQGRSNCSRHLGSKVQSNIYSPPHFECFMGIKYLLFGLVLLCLLLASMLVVFIYFFYHVTKLGKIRILLNDRN